ncbi:Pantothenate transporter liz1 [Cytospora mali]|uniref:Pantothenate transporter liz1 n=1 Tax=Cytospora mali TaxID=578113 RepID=A0A194VAW4_CYTMA|nr:Pantothenate transporter liz1 [Valsa mali var. pyri (nom. inval.)]
MKAQGEETVAVSASELPVSPSSTDGRVAVEKKTFLQKFKGIVWDTLERSPEERRFLAKIDFFILTWAGLTYFSKNLNTNNVSNAYVSGMKEELQVVGNEYQTFTTMWTMWVWRKGRSILQYIQSSADELAKRACIFFASAFVGSMFSGYLQAALYTGMDGVGGLSGWRWLFVFDGVITLPMALWGYYALPDLPSTTRVRWLKPEEKALALDRMKRAGKQLEEPFTMQGLKRILKKWHFWVYTAYYTFFICSENIGSYMNLWLKSLDRYPVSEINTYPTVISAITIVTTLSYGWVSDSLQVRAPIVYFSLAVCLFAAINLAVWDGVPFGLKWASFYLTGFAQGSGPVFLTMVNEECAGDSLERKFILGTTNTVAYAFNAWIPLLTYDTIYAPRFLVGNTTTVCLIVFAALTLTLAVVLQQRDAVSKPPPRHEEAGEVFAEKGNDGSRA